MLDIPTAPTGSIRCGVESRQITQLNLQCDRYAKCCVYLLDAIVFPWLRELQTPRFVFIKEEVVRHQAYMSIIQNKYMLLVRYSSTVY